MKKITKNLKNLLNNKQLILYYLRALDMLRYTLNTIDYHLFYHPKLLKRLKNWENSIISLLALLWHVSLFTLMPCFLINMLSVALDFLVSSLFYLFMMFLWLALAGAIVYKHSKPDFNPEKYK